jgi:hypothetical protein
MIPVKDYYNKYTIDDGKHLNGRTLAMLREAEWLLGAGIHVIQGSFNKGVKASAGTHDGGGVIDVPAKIGAHNQLAIVEVMRRVGFAAWHRLPSEGPWVEHIHCVALGDKQLAPLAKQQGVAYLEDFNGLGHLGKGGKDNGPRDHVQTFEAYKKNHPNRFSTSK